LVEDRHRARQHRHEPGVVAGDAALIAAALDAARTLDDFVGHVVALGAGELPDDGRRDRSLRALARRALSASGFGSRHVVQGMAVRYAPEQLRKAAREAEELRRHVAALDTAPGTIGREAADETRRLGADRFAATL